MCLTLPFPACKCSREGDAERYIYDRVDILPLSYTIEELEGGVEELARGELEDERGLTVVGGE